MTALCFLHCWLIGEIGKIPCYRHITVYKCKIDLQEQKWGVMIIVTLDTEEARYDTI